MRNKINDELSRTGGLLRLLPAYVARDWLPAGHRLGLAPEQYDVGERGEICERWLASTTHADNRVGPEDEGISAVRLGEHAVPLPDVIKAAGDLVMGASYASTHAGLGRLLKIFDFSERIPYHLHPPADVAARVGRSSKDEAYYFLGGVDRGAYPETYFGLLPHLDEEAASSLLLKDLEAWNSKEILCHSQAYRQPVGEGFLVESGILHAPGTALTLELQEDADTMSFWQAENAGEIISKDLLFKDVSEQERAERGEAALLDWVDWSANLDPTFYRNHHTPPQPDLTLDGVSVEWVFYGTTKFSGKRIVIQPGASVTLTERGVHSLFVWRGEGSIGGLGVRAGTDTLDELLVSHSRAAAGTVYVNSGHAPLEVFATFGPDINANCPTVPGRES